MKKYKLTKTYPGSPFLGKVLEPKVGKEENNTNNFYWGGNWFNPNDFPEFWEEEVEKDYEILSFKQDSGIKDLWTFFTSGWGRNVNGQCATNPYTTEEILSNKLYTIHSVKRLSDGEVFTVGDNITSDCYSHSLDKIILYEKYILLQHNYSTRTISHNLNNTNKCKSLFTTEDGVDIFQPTLVWRVNKYFYLNPSGDYMISKGCDSYKCFSTKEKAKEYVLMNKPCLSLKEVLSIVTFLDRSEKKLKDLVKQKLIK